MSSITTRVTAGSGATVKNAPLTNAEIDNNFINLNVDKEETSNLVSTNTASKGVRRDASGNFAASQITSTGLLPTTTNTNELGATDNRWKTLYASLGSATTPSVSFGSTLATTGFYSSTEGVLNFTNGGVDSGNITSGNLTMVGSVSAYSDSRLKTDLIKIENALSKVIQLTGYTFTRIDTQARQTGLLAQDVDAVMPEAVMKDSEYLSVAYGNLVGLLVEAIKELNDKVDALGSK